MFLNWRLFHDTSLCKHWNIPRILWRRCYYSNFLWINVNGTHTREIHRILTRADGPGGQGSDTSAARHGHLLQSEQWQDGRQSVTINNHRDVQKYFSGQKIFHIPRTLADIQFRYSSDDFGGLDRACDGQTLLETILKLWIVVKVKPKRKWNSVRDWSTTYCSYISPPMVRISIAMIYWDSSQRGEQCHCRKNS